ncbi:MAG TPA: NEW3 domain-containing protein [Candidatus Limnocylindrales bacterium]|nr:NEW3 domain-containing protein [Candidatus Limnocylindrales bacterium]
MATVRLLPAGVRLSRAGRRGISIAALAALTVSLLAPIGAFAADPLTITTPYPAVAVSAGSKVSFQLTVKADQERQVALSVSGAPTGWSAVFRGGGFVVDSVTATKSGTPPDVRLDVSVPADAAGGPRAASLTVTAKSGGLTATLPLVVRVSEGGGGSVAMTADYPTLKGTASQTYNFSLSLSNDTPEDLTFSLAAQGPDGWTVTAKPTGQSQAASAVVKAGESSTISVEADPPSDADAGDYPIQVSATAGDKTANQQLGVTITGSYKMTVTTPDQRLSASGGAGSTISETVRIQNDGSAPLTNVTFDKTAPSKWDVTFTPTTVDSIAPGSYQDVTAAIKPAGDAIAGDYVVNLSAKSAESSGNADFRITVETSPIWGIVGLLLIVAIVAGLVWVFRAYGRR